MALASRFVRASKFRHVFAEPEKPDNHYLDLELSPVTGDHNYVRGNGKYFSVSARGGGGPVLVLPYKQVGKLPRGYPVLNGHAAAVLDTAWNPFNDNMLATGSDDTTVKIWSIPEGGLTETQKEPLQTLTGHYKPVSLLNWHPVASNVLASVGKEPSVRIWDVEKGAAGITLSGFEGLVQDVCWNTNGSLLATADKAKAAKVHDPRAGAIAHEWKPHSGGKPFKLLFLGDSTRMLTVGFTAQAKREFKIWDVAAGLASPLTTYELDQSAGALLPFYDDDTKVLFLTGKGDGNVRYFELVDEAPFVHYLAEHRTNVSTKGADMLPKRACNALRCEMGRMLKLTSDSVEPISFIVPRKETSFQEDIFPETFAGQPALTADAWFSGSNAPPKKMSMDPAKNAGLPRPAAIFNPVAASSAPAPVSAAAGGGGASSPAASSDSGISRAELDAALHRAAAAEAKAADLSKQLAAAKAEVETVKASAAAAAAGGATEAASPAAGGGAMDDGESAAAIAGLKDELSAAQGRISDLEKEKARLKAALAAFSA